jgi:multidrug efflux pump
VVRTLGDPAQVYEVAEQIRAKALATGRFIVVTNSVSYETPRARIIVDRERAATLGVRVSEIGATLGALVGGAPISKFDRDNRSYDVISQVSQENRLNPERLAQYYVRASSGAMIPLSALVKIETGASPAIIEQFNQLNAATISALPLPNVTTTEGLQTLRSIAAEVMPAGFYEDFAGQSRLEIQEGHSIALAFGLALIVIYLVLAAQFESFRDPFIIMMSVPLSMFGAIAFLNLGLATLNIYTQVGLITLVGLITKHGILMVEFANELKAKKGLSRRQAIEQAAKVRLRPILMTTAAMVLGVVPLLTATGAGAAARFSMGLVIAAGMSIGTIFTLFVVPMFYTLIAKETSKAMPADQSQPEHAAVPAAG